MWQTYIVVYELRGMIKQVYITATSKIHAKKIFLSSGNEDEMLIIKNIIPLVDKY